VDLWYGGSTSAGSAKGASEPSANLAPRLDRREHNLPGAQVHCIICVGHGKRRVVVIAFGVVFSKAVNGSFDQPIPKHATAAWSASERHGVGAASRRSGVTGTVPVAGNAIALSSSVIGNANGPRCGPLRRQLTRRRRAWASAQLRRTKIFQNGCATGQAVMSPW
jgi:hypothetical protein